MTKEYRYEGMPGVLHNRPKHVNAAGRLLERDVSEWRPSPPESEALVRLRELRAMTKADVARIIGVKIGDDSYERDTAILFYLIGIYGIVKTQDAVAELIGAETNKESK